MNQKEIELFMSELSESVFKVEQSLGMGAGTLQKALNGKRELPIKWVNSLLTYFKEKKGKEFNSDILKVKNSLNELKDKVTTANEVPPPKSKTMLDEIIEDRKKEKWVTDIEKYCELEGITPEDLILSHKERKKPLKQKKGTNTPKNDESVENGSKTGNSGHSNWFEGYRKAKLGIK